MIKKILASLVFLVSIFVVPVSLFLYFTYNKLTNPEFYANYLKGANFIEFYLKEKSDILTKVGAENFIELSPKLNTIFNRNIVDRQFYFIIKETIDYLCGRGMFPDCKIELTKTKLELKEVLNSPNIINYALKSAINLLPDIFDTDKLLKTKIEVIKPVTIKLYKYRRKTKTIY